MRSLFRKDPVKSQAEAIYSAVVDQARSPVFYTLGRVPDTPEGRFELVGLHMFLALQRLGAEAPATNALSNALQKAFFHNMEDSLREMGVGDLSVGKKLRRMAEAFYGRLNAYKEACSQSGEDDLTVAVARNVFGTTSEYPARAFSLYLRRSVDELNSIADPGELAAGFEKLKALAAPAFGEPDGDTE